MVGKVKKAVKQKTKKKSSNAHPTFEEKLSDTVSRMKDITEGNNQRHHLR